MRPFRVGVIALKAMFFVGVLIVCDGLIGVALWMFISPLNFEVSEVFTEKMRIRSHPYRIYMNEPGSTAWGSGSRKKTLGYEWDFSISEEGAVADEFGHYILHRANGAVESAAGPEQLRMLFLGGSTTYQPWPFYVGAALEDGQLGDAIPVVINAGTGGYTSQENLIDLAISGFTYRPKWVFAYLPINDIYHIAQYPRFKRDYTHARTAARFVVAPNSPREPQLGAIRYPFLLQLCDVLAYNKAMVAYASQVNMTWHFSPQPAPYLSGDFIDEDSYEETVSAVEDNVLSMAALCRARGVRFVLITQKVFPSSNLYYDEVGQSSVHVKFYRVMDEHTRRAVGSLSEVAKSQNIEIIRMHELMPDYWDPASLRLVRDFFPNYTPDTGGPLSSDAMHFTPDGLRLFAAIVASYVSNSIQR